MLREPRLRVTYKEMPPFSASWQLKPAGEFPEHFADIFALEECKDPGSLDWTLRMDFPSRLEKPSHGRLLVFATNEFQNIEPSNYVGRSVDEAFTDPETFFLTPSMWSAKAFYERGVAPERVWVIPHGVDAEDFQRSSPLQRLAYRNQFGLKEGEHLFLHIGAGTFNKGLDVLLMAFAVHCERHNDSRLIVKGHDSLYGNAVGNAVRSPNFKLPSSVSFPYDRVIYVGEDLTLSQIHQLYRTADSYLSPYRAEGFNMPALEALAHGLHLAVTRGGSTDDFVGAFDHARLVPGQLCLMPESRRFIEPDVMQLLEVMDELTAQAPIDYETLDRCGQRAIKKFTWQAIVDSLVMRLATA